MFTLTTMLMFLLGPWDDVHRAIIVLDEILRTRVDRFATRKYSTLHQLLVLIRYKDVLVIKFANGT